MRKIISIVLKVTILFALAYYIFHDINISLLIPAFNSYSLFWLGVSVISVILSDLILALRWRSLSRNSCSLKASFESIVFSVLANTLLPAKLGEVAKLFYLQKLYNIKLSHGFSLMLTERFFDILVLGILVVISAQIYWDNLNVQIFGWLTIFFIISLFFLIKHPISRKIIHWIPGTFLRKWLIRLYHHFQIVLAKESIITLSLWSLLLWFSYIFTTMLFFYAVMDLPLNFTQLFIATMVSFIAFSIPLLPAGSGTFQAGIIFILTQYGIGKEEALLGSIVLQLIMVLPSTIISLVLIQKKNLSLKELMRSTH
jgi:uncharacterized protein (TIRG00374 family)